MSGGQIAALIFAIILAALLALAGFLFWIAFRRRRQAPGTAPTDRQD
jgi:ribonucleotide reductase beta subunit family protein with ferritin-like domain